MKAHWPHDDAASMDAFYGNPHGANGQASRPWMAANLTHVVFPWRAVLAWAPHERVNACLFHIKAADALEEAFKQVWKDYGQNQAKIEADGIHLFGGSFNYRLKRGGTSLSIHSWGAAIDINPGAFPFPYKGQKKQPLALIEAFKDQGAIYGGDWSAKSRDPMHFQFATE